MSATPTPKQALILWCLLGRQGSALQSDIVPKIDKADREALIANGYLSAEKQGRSLRLTVTDGGWNWAGAHLREALPANLRVLQDWLALIHSHLTTTGGTLADLVGPASEPAIPTPAPKRPSRKPATPVPKTPTPRQLRARIEDAYLVLTGGARAKAVRLSALRAELADLDRGSVDLALAGILKGDTTARLSQLSDPKAVNAAERAAAYSPAGEPFHLLFIQ